MTKTLLETFLFASVAINAALLIFISGVLRKMMNDVDESTFKKLIESLFRNSARSPFMVMVLNVPLIVAIPYFYFYGFTNWRITAGIVLWLVAGSISKLIKLPVYKAISRLKNDELIQLKVQRRKFNAGNQLQAWLYSVAVIMMFFGLH
jgi:hypothetical protein